MTVGKGEVRFNGLHINIIGKAECPGLDIAFASGKLVEVFVAGKVGREADIVPQEFGFVIIRGGKTETGHHAVYAGCIVNHTDTIALCLQVTVVSGCEGEVLTQTGRGIGGIDIAASGIELFARQIVCLTGESTGQGYLIKLGGTQVKSQTVIVVGHIVSSQ